MPVCLCHAPIPFNFFFFCISFRWNLRYVLHKLQFYDNRFNTPFTKINITQPQPSHKRHSSLKICFSFFLRSHQNVKSSSNIYTVCKIFSLIYEIFWKCKNIKEKFVIWGLISGIMNRCLHPTYKSFGTQKIYNIQTLLSICIQNNYGQHK